MVPPVVAFVLSSPHFLDKAKTSRTITLQCSLNWILNTATVHVLPIGTKTRRTSENKKEAAANGINSKIGAQYEVALLMPFLMPPHYLALARSVEGLSICERERGNSKHFYRATALRWTYLI